MTPEIREKAPLPLAALTGVIASLSVFAIAQGLSYPLFTFMMQRQGMTPAEIGLSAAMTPLGLIASAFFVPAAVRLIGARGLATICALSAAFLLVLVGLLQNDIAWYPVRFLIGVAINPLFILGEVWTLALAPPERRGRIMGVFNAVTGIGYAAGPLTLAFVGSEGWPPLMVGIAAFAACAGLLFATTARLRGFEDDDAPKAGVRGFWLVAPTLLLAVVVFAATQQSVYSLLPVFGAAYGLPEATLAALITAMSAGNILLQLPLGVLAEKLGARPMIVACALVNSTCALLLPILVTTPLAWPIVLVMGGVGYGVYTMALVELGNRFRGSVLVPGYAAFALMWGVGGIVGPPGSGLIMQAAGPVGMPVLLATLGLGLVVFAAVRSLPRR